MIARINAHNIKYSTGFDVSSWEDEAEYLEGILERYYKGEYKCLTL